MTDDLLLRMLEELFREVFMDPSLSLRPETTAADVPDWDSFNHVSLISKIEKKWKIRFSLQELQSFQKVGDILLLLKKKCQTT